MATFLVNHGCQRYDSISDWAVDKVLGCDYVGLEGTHMERLVVQSFKSQKTADFSNTNFGKPVSPLM